MQKKLSDGIVVCKNCNREFILTKGELNMWDSFAINETDLIVLRCDRCYVAKNYSKMEIERTNSEW